MSSMHGCSAGGMSIRGGPRGEYSLYRRNNGTGNKPDGRSDEPPRLHTNLVIGKGSLNLNRGGQTEKLGLFGFGCHCQIYFVGLKIYLGLAADLHLGSVRKNSIFFHLAVLDVESEHGTVNF